MTYYAGLDVSLKEISICVVDNDGEVVTRGTAPADPAGVAGWFKNRSLEPQRIAHESGQLSIWLQGGMVELGLPAACIDARKDLEGHIRGMLKTFGIRMIGVGQGRQRQGFRDQLATVGETDPVLCAIADGFITAHARLCQATADMDRALQAKSKSHPITRRLMAIPGVSPIVSLSFVALVDDPTRFSKTPDVGAFLGLKRFALNLKHLTLPEIKDFNALSVTRWIKLNAKRCRGYDAGKRIKSRKRHIVTDTVGLLIGLVVHSDGIQDRDGAPDVLKMIASRYPSLRHVFADGGSAGPKLRDALKALGRWTVQIIKRSDTAQGFEVLPRRWVVERTFAWLNRCRRLSKDWEKSIASAEAWILIAHIRRVTRHLARD